MARNRQHVTEAELAVLKSLWEEQPATIRSITERLYGGADTSLYATVQTLLGRLEAKGCVKRDRKTTPHQYSAGLDRAGLISRRLRDVADTLCGGSISPLLTYLIEGSELSAQELETLRTLVKDLDRKRKGN